jgi:hypothetical protein
VNPAVAILLTWEWEAGMIQAIIITIFQRSYVFSDRTGQIHSCFALALNERPGLEVRAVKSAFVNQHGI